jgi:histidinol-phosphatase
VNLSDVRALAHELADVADSLSMAAFDGVRDVRTKPDGSVVTATDIRIEQELRARILAEFPGHRVMGEEEGASAGDRGSPRWIIDPIDATTNFVKGNPVFATLIGVEVDGMDAVGVISAPALATRWDGVVGEGARQDGRAIGVSRVSSVSGAEISFGALGDIERALPGLIATLALGTERQRGFGDFWAYCLLASGSTDVVLEARLNHWDLAAVRALVVAAGGRVTDLDGLDRSDGGSAVATNGTLHGDILALVGSHRAA